MWALGKSFNFIFLILVNEDNKVSDKIEFVNHTQMLTYYNQIGTLMHHNNINVEMISHCYPTGIDKSVF